VPDSLRVIDSVNLVECQMKILLDVFFSLRPFSTFVSRKMFLSLCLGQSREMLIKLYACLPAISLENVPRIPKLYTPDCITDT
jgi:hypothetical protein